MIIRKTIVTNSTGYPYIYLRRFYLNCNCHLPNPKPFVLKYDKKNDPVNAIYIDCLFGFC
jgi:hypothetical protein